MQALKMNRAFSTRSVAPSVRASAVKPFRAAVVEVRAERLRLGNLSPSPGSHRDKQRKGRGYGAGQGGTCGFGNRGQKARSGSSVRPGFEGGQSPLYRRMPKLRGIAGGMSAGVPDFVVINVEKLEGRFQPNEEVSLATLKEKGIIRASGKRRTMPLKVLGNGEIKTPLNIKAAAFSEQAKAKIEAAGGKAEVDGVKPKWTRGRHNRMVADMKKEGKDYAAEKLKKRVANLKAKGMLKNDRSVKKAAKPAAKSAKAK